MFGDSRSFRVLNFSGKGFGPLTRVYGLESWQWEVRHVRCSVQDAALCKSSMILVQGLIRF